MLNRVFLIRLVLVLFIPLCLIDTLNGYFLNNGVVFPISIVYKLILLSVLVIAMIDSLRLISFFILITLISLYHTMNYDMDISSDISVLIKIMTFFLLVGFFYLSSASLEESDLIKIERIFFFSTIVVFINVFSGLLGVGYTTYGSLPASEYLGRGFKGFFFAGNELGALLICLYPIVISSISNNSRIRLVFNFLFLICSVLISTKTAILGLLILVIYDLYHSSKKTILYKIALVIIIPLFFISGFFIFSEHIYERIVSLSYFLNNKGVWYVVFTGRNDFITDAMHYVTNNFALMDFIFGVSVPFADSKFKSTEMDLIDLSIWFGMVFSVLIYSFYYLFARRILALVDNNIKPLIKLTLILLLFISIFAGHVFTSAMVLPFLSLYYPYFYLKARVGNEIKK